MRRFEGRVVLVTGAGRGIGAAIADHFLAEGARVVRGDIAGGDLELDVRDRKSIAAAMGSIGGKHGGLDVLVNNAGLICTGPAEQTSGEEWDNLLATNLTGLFNCIQAALALMQGRAGASIVNIAWVSAEKGGGAIGETGTELTQHTEEALSAQGVDLIHFDEPAFRFAVNEDAMATEKTAEGIRVFSADIIKLEKLVRAKRS